jgi:riboflavin biosynthesis pyrimidine reductase
VITTVGDLGEWLGCARERATVDDYSVMRALVTDAIAELLSEGGADCSAGGRTRIANRRAEVSLGEMA